jgi:hypothetical protein
MAWWNAIGDALTGGKDLARVFKADATETEEHRHEEVMADVDRDKAVMAQFAAEFMEKKNRTWWDSFVDGLNRAVRPLITFGILAFFIIAPLDPERFLLIAESYSLMPNGYWALLSVIISFYFGGRMQIKAQDMTLKKNAVQAAKNLVAMKKEFRQLDQEEESKESKIYEAVVAEEGKPPLTNKVIAEWLAFKKNR